MQEHLEEMVNELKDGKAQLFDVREQDEWDAGHLESATLVPLSQLNEGMEPEGKSKELKTYIHCRSGNRVHMAAPLLQDMGFSDIIPLSEGYDELAEEGIA